MTQVARSKILNAFADVFPQEPIFLTDSEELLAYLKDSRLQHARFTPHLHEELSMHLRENVVLLFTTFDYYAWSFLERNFSSSRLFMLPLVSFDPSLKAAMYTLDRIGDADFSSSTRENKNILEFLATTTQPFHVTGSGCELHCELSNKIRLMKPKTEAALLPGEWEAAGMWFETALMPDEEDVFHPGHIVSGVFQASGAAVARHRQMPESLVPHHQSAWDLMRQLHEAREFPLTVKIEKSQVQDVTTASGTSLRQQLLPMTNERHDLMLLEVAFSGNSKLSAQTLDWTMNAVVNEGAKGMHIGIGDGITGAHIDLIAPGAFITEL